MSWQWKIIGEAGLQFFGKMSASLSHEIKNVLAIMNEHAGLLSDFSLMAEKGRSIDLVRLKILAGKIVEQIRRADGIVNNINRFAHSVDESVQSVDLGEVLELVAALSGRLAAMRGVTFEPLPPREPVTITTHPFFLENLVWLSLDFAIGMAGKNGTVGLIPEKMETGAKIRVTRLEGLGNTPMDEFPSEREKALLSALKSELAIDVASGEIVITLPRDIGH